MTDFELGLRCLHLNPRCEQFKPYIMEESLSDSTIVILNLSSNVWTE